MRRKFTPQMSLFAPMARNSIVKELEQISKVLDANPRVLELVFKDLVKTSRPDTGRQGMTAEQVLRSAVLKQYRELTYEELAFHCEDSDAFRAFARLEMGQYPSKSILQENIKAIREETWEAIHGEIVGYAREEKIEKGRTVRVDATAVETNIHHPTDSTLLSDGIRIITRWLAEGKELSPQPHYQWSDHRRVVKKRLMTILNAKKDAVRHSAYRDLLHYARQVAGYAEVAIPELTSYEGHTLTDTFAGQELARRLERAVRILKKVIDQTDRRVFKGEKVPASEKVVSFFEDHTDIIVKGRRDTEYGHKVFLTGGTSNMILGCIIVRGNPADSDQYQSLLLKHKEQYGRMPRQVTADGGFASKENLAFAKEKGVKDAAFAKKRGLSILDMAKSSWVYKKLRNFRAGIEAGISVLKRAFGLDRCTWTGWEGFKRYVWSTIVSYNLISACQDQARLGLIENNQGEIITPEGVRAPFIGQGPECRGDIRRAAGKHLHRMPDQPCWRGVRRVTIGVSGWTLSNFQIPFTPHGNAGGAKGSSSNFFSSLIFLRNGQGDTKESLPFPGFHI